MFPTIAAVKNPKKSGIKNGIFKRSRCFKENRPGVETARRKREKEREKTAAKKRELRKTEKAKDEKTEKKDDRKNESAEDEKRIGKKKTMSKNALQSAPPKIPR